MFRGQIVVLKKISAENRLQTTWNIHSPLSWAAAVLANQAGLGFSGYACGFPLLASQVGFLMNLAGLLLSKPRPFTQLFCGKSRKTSGKHRHACVPTHTYNEMNMLFLNTCICAYLPAGVMLCDRESTGLNIRISGFKFWFCYDI